MSRRDWGSGSIDERSPGRWRVMVPLARDPLTGKRRRRRFTVHGTKRDAQAALIKALHERDHGGVDPDNVTTGEWLAHWIDQHVSDGALGPETEYNYRGILRNHLVPAFGGVRLQELSYEHISSLKDELVKSRAPATVVRVLGVLNTALRSAVKQRLLASNPALDVPRPSGGRPHRVRHGRTFCARYRRTPRGTARCQVGSSRPGHSLLPRDSGIAPREGGVRVAPAEGSRPARWCRCTPS